MNIEYEGQSYTLDLEDMDTDQARAMQRYGVPNLQALTDGVQAGDVDALTVCYWVMLQQSGEPGARLERVKFKPVKFLQAMAAAAEAEAAKADTPKAGGAQQRRGFRTQA